MEKILVAIDGKHGAWEALSHACSLAKRIHVQLNVLLVIPPSKAYLSHAEAEAENHIKKRLELLIEAAKSENITINYFIAEGNYDDEVINFVNNNKITLLVHETPEGDTRPAGNELAASLGSLRHRIACKMEVVAPKKTYT
ncbi:MAG: universal stress protein [Desulfoprunum sp.]|nr:universal stress protein [Desulfoprunum sp.]